VNNFFNCTSLAVLTILLISAIIRIRAHLSTMYYFKVSKNTQEKDLNWLKLRTVEIECRLD
jgi:hypothetical protein